MDGDRTRKARVIVGGVAVGVLIAVVVFWPRAAEVPTGEQAAKESDLATAERAPALLRGSAAASDVAAPRRSETKLPPPPLGPSQYAIEGVVRDAASSTALPGISVQLHGRDKQAPDVAATDGNGRFRFVRDVGDERISWFVVRDPKWILTRGHVEGRPTETGVRREAGAVTEFVLWMSRVFHLRGTVVDELQRPVARAKVGYGFPVSMDGGDGTPTFGTVGAATDENGRFQAGPFTEEAGAGVEEPHRKAAADVSMLTVSDEGHATVRVDPRSIPFHDRDDVTIVLSTGVTLAGMLVDSAGKPLSDAVVVAEYGPEEYALRRGTRTNPRGQWRLKHLAAKELALVAHAFDDGAKARRVIAKPVDDADVRLVADPIRLSKEPRTVKVLGVALVDVDEEIRAAFDMRPDVHVMVYDTDTGSFTPDRLVLGHVEKGYGIRMVGAKPVASVRDLLEQLVAEPSREDRLRSTEVSRHIAYAFWDETGSGGSDLVLYLDEARTASLKATLESLKR